VTSLRPSGFDELGLKRALSDRMLPLLVAAMAFLAALAMAGWFGTAALSQRWQQGAGASLTVQVPQASDPSAGAGQMGGNQTGADQTGGNPAGAGQAGGNPARGNQRGGNQTGSNQTGGNQAGGDQAGGNPTRGGETRLAAVLALLTGTPGVASAHALTDQELTDLLRPWLGQGAERLAIPVPAVIAVRLTDTEIDLAPLSRRLAEAAPGTLVEDHGVWISRLTVLARSLQACAGLALLLVAGVAAAVISVATRAGLSTRREAIEIVHGLGATDGYIAGRFAARATMLAAIGAVGGALVALPVLLALARMAAPFAGETIAAGDSLQAALETLPAPLWLALPCLPVSAAAIGFVTAHGAVRRWLRRLP
jgi:cell division transport system permease protein